MVPERHSISDQESVSEEIRRGRPPVPPARVLAAAARLFVATDAPGEVTMDAVAAAAGVGKGTLFRAFGSRDGLLDALWAAKLAGFRQAMEEAGPPLGPGAPSRDRLPALLDALLSFKLENRQLIRARETAPAGLLRSAHYRATHELLRSLVQDAAPGATAAYAGYCAHALLAALHLDVVDDLLASGLSIQAIRRAQAAHVQAIIAGRAVPPDGAQPVLERSS